MEISLNFSFFRTFFPKFLVFPDFQIFRVISFSVQKNGKISLKSGNFLVFGNTAPGFQEPKNVALFVDVFFFPQCLRGAFFISVLSWTSKWKVLLPILQPILIGKFNFSF